MALRLFAMWSVMMVGMMLPSGTPAVLQYARTIRSERHAKRPAVHIAVFAAVTSSCDMNLTVIVALTLIVPAERIAPFGIRSTLVRGGVLIGLGLWVMAR